MRHINTVSQKLLEAVKLREQNAREAGFYVQSETFFYSEKYLALHNIADWQSTPLNLKQFAGHYLLYLRSLHVPCHVAFAERDKIHIAHSLLGTQLNFKQLALLRKTGMVIADRYRFRVSPLGKLVWQGPAGPEVLTTKQPLWLTPNKLKNSY